MTAGAQRSRRRHRSAPFIPEVWGPTRPSWAGPQSAPSVRSTVVAFRPAPVPEIGAAEQQEVQALWQSPELHAHPDIKRLSERLSDHAFEQLLLILTRLALDTRARCRRLLGDAEAPLLLIIANTAHALTDDFLSGLAAVEVGIPGLVAQLYASRDRLAAIWMRSTAPACDWLLPERRAIEQGPEAMRAFVSAGGMFGAEPDALLQTDAHIAAIATTRHPLALATFLKLGGPFNDGRDHQGRTPSWHLIGAGSPQAVRAFIDAGGRLTPCTDMFGDDLASMAAVWGPAMQKALSDAIGAASS